MMRRYAVIVLMNAALVLSCTDTRAQVAIQPDSGSVVQEKTSQNLNVRLLYDIYNLNTPLFSTYMYAADISAYPLFAAGPLAMWGVELVEEGANDLGPAYLMFLSEALAGVTFFAVKQVFRKPRPHVVFDDIDRRRIPGTEDAFYNNFDFPSGHSSIAFAQAMSLSLTYPEWYVIVPSFLWASSVGVSRIWMGMHFPGSVAAGAVLGTLVATGVYLVRDHITPAFLEGDEHRNSGAPMISLYLQL